MTSPSARSASSRGRVTFALVMLVLLVLVGWLIKSLSGPADLRTEKLSALPVQAGQTYRLITAHGPFPYPGRDGAVFGNREGLLPDEAGDYYHEYTVPTPHSPDRGARRLITGEHGELYYTGDHYASFVSVDPKH